MAIADSEQTEQLTILYEDGENGWVAARVQEFPAAISQGRTRAEARANVIEALRDLVHHQTPAERLADRLRHFREQAAAHMAARLRARVR